MVHVCCKISHVQSWNDGEKEHVEECLAENDDGVVVKDDGAVVNDDVVRETCYCY